MKSKMEDRDLSLEFKTLVKEVVFPIFQEYGFKKNGNNFYRDINGIGQAINVQQSHWNTKDDKSFVFNFDLIDKEIYAEIHKKNLPKFPKEYDCEIRLRLGNLMNKGDYWYNLSPQIDFLNIKEIIHQDLKTFAIPFIEKYSDPKKWLEFFEWEYEPPRSPLENF